MELQVEARVSLARHAVNITKVVLAVVTLLSARLLRVEVTQFRARPWISTLNGAV